MRDLGVSNVFAKGGYSLLFHVPRDWTRVMNDGQSVWCRPDLRGGIEYYLSEVAGSRQMKMQVREGRWPYLTIPADIARTHGLRVGDKVCLWADRRKLVARRVA